MTEPQRKLQLAQDVLAAHDDIKDPYEAEPQHDRSTPNNGDEGVAVSHGVIRPCIRHGQQPAPFKEDFQSSHSL